MLQKVKILSEFVKKNPTDFFLLSVGFGLAFFQLCYDRSLWLDEAMLANNIIQRNFFTLFLPLDNNQLAPAAYLFLLKIVGVFTNYHAIAFRAVSLLAYLGSLYYSYRLLRVLVNHSVAFSISLVLLVFNPLLLYYATEVKPYIFDVFVTVVILYYTLHFESIKKNIWLSVCVAILFVTLSHISVFVWVGGGLYLFFTVDEKTDKAKLITLFAVLAVGAFLYYLLFLYKHPSAAHLHAYWQKENSFLLTDNPILFYRKIEHILYDLFLIPLYPKILLLFIAVSVLCSTVKLIIKNNSHLLLFLATPVLLHLLSAAFHIYPIESRLVLYFIPFLLIFMALFLQDVFTRLLLFFPSVKHFILLVAVAFYSFLFFKNVNFPFKHEEVKPLLATIQAKAKPTEVLYLYYAATPAFAYYQHIGFIRFENTKVYGNTHYTSFSQFQQDLEAIPKGRYWMLLSHEYHGEIAFSIKYIRNHYHLINEYTTEGAALLYFEKN